jgi:outer membrane protein insertion porin family
VESGAKLRFDPRNLTAILLGLLALLPLPSQAVLAQSGTVERVIIQGLRRMDEQAFLYLLDIEVGDPYDVSKLRKRFQVLWQEHLFEDITVESEVGPEGGTVLVIKVRERPQISSITYEDNKEITQTQIEDHFKERKIKLTVGQPLDMGQVFFAEAAIRELFAQKGFLDATVEGRVHRVTDTTRALEFKLTPGGKTRIRGITFVDNEVLSDRKLKSLLKLTQERKWYWPWSAKNLYHPVKWDQDIGGVRDAYQNRGYLDVEVHAPIVEVRHKKPGKEKEKEKEPEKGQEKEQEEKQDEQAAAEETPAEDSAPQKPLTTRQQRKEAKKSAKQIKKARKKERKSKASESKRWVYLTVPVTEGKQYQLGQISFTGNDVFADGVLRGTIPMAEGDVFNNQRLRAGVNLMTRLYEDRGHLYANVVSRIERREEEAVADVTITLDEDRPFYVGRIEFRGNSSTRDRVLRREVQLLEGELFSRTKLDVSTIKVNQLGYFQVLEEPVIEPLEDENRVKITLAGVESGRNEIQIGGGFSGLEGAFFSGVYSTRNFLGRGQVLSAAVQIGGRSNRYQLSFQEPWFLGRPYLFGASLFRTETDFGNNLRTSSSGFGIRLGRRLTRFSNLNVAYNFEDVNSSSVATGLGGNTVTLTTTNEISSVTPVYLFSSINNPYRPTRGTSFTLSAQVAGGPLGGTVSYIRPLAFFTAYRPFLRKAYLAFHAEVGVIRAFGDQSLVSTTSNIEGVPRFQRFWLGGDTLGPRIFETRTITPRRFLRVVDGVIIEALRDVTGLPPDDFININGVPIAIEVGGDRMYLWQTELVFPMTEQAELAAFVDLGDALFEDTSLNFSSMRISAGLEVRFHLPIFPVPLRLIYGVPIREVSGDRTGSFTFSIGRSF